MSSRRDYFFGFFRNIPSEASFNAPISCSPVSVHTLLQNSQNLKGCPPTSRESGTSRLTFGVGNKRRLGRIPLLLNWLKGSNFFSCRMCNPGKRECRYSCKLSAKEKRSRKGGNTEEGILMNGGYLQDQDAAHTKKLIEKEELQRKKKKEAKKVRGFQAEGQSLWKMTASAHSRQSAKSQPWKQKSRPEIIPKDSFFFEERNATAEPESDSWLYAPLSPPKSLPSNVFLSNCKHKNLPRTYSTLLDLR